jgi:hypothetical protein
MSRRARQRGRWCSIGELVCGTERLVSSAAVLKVGGDHSLRAEWVQILRPGGVKGAFVGMPESGGAAYGHLAPQ